MLERRPRLSGILCLAGAGILSFVCQSLDAHGASRTVHAAASGVGVFMLLLAITGVALLIHGAESFRQHHRLRKRKEPEVREEVAPLIPDTAPAGWAYDTIEGTTFMQSRFARRQRLQKRRG